MTTRLMYDVERILNSTGYSAVFAIRRSLVRNLRLCCCTVVHCTGIRAYTCLTRHGWPDVKPYPTGRGSGSSILPKPNDMSCKTRLCLWVRLRGDQTGEWPSHHPRILLWFESYVFRDRARRGSVSWQHPILLLHSGPCFTCFKYQSRGGSGQ